MFLFTDLIFALPISPLFHLLPIGVIVVLVSSWIYLTNCMTALSHKPTPREKMQTKPRRSRLRTRKAYSGSIGRLFRRVNRRFKSIDRVLESFYQRYFSRPSVKSTVTIAGLFVGVLLVLLVLGYPSFIHEIVVGFYKANPSFHGFVLKTFEMTQGIGQALAPLGWLGSEANSMLLAVAPSFRTGLEGFGTSITGSLVELDLVWKYAICQNVAAWGCALTALAYRQYTSRPRRRFKRR